MKIHIFYRQYNISGKSLPGRPSWFDYEKCFTNLLKTISNKNVELHVVMDGDSNTNFISKYKNQYTLHQIKAGGDQSSFFQAWHIAKGCNLEDDDLIYFLENDYMHMPNWVDKTIELFSSYKLPHYVSLYDNKDKYLLAQYDDLLSKILITDTHHWRTTASACGSFIVNKELFDLDFDINTTVAGDHNKFMLLNEKRNRMVISPMPGLSTHCVDPLLSPTIDWSTI